MWAKAQFDSHSCGAVLTTAVSSLDRLTQKIHLWNQTLSTLAVMQPKLCRFECLPAPPHAQKKQPILAVGGGTPTMFGMDIVA